MFAEAVFKMAIITAVVLLILLVPGVLAGNIQGVALNNTLTLGYLVPWEQGITFGPYLGSAIILGIQEVHLRGLLSEYKIEWVLRDDYCEPQRGMQVTVDIWNSVSDLDGFIGSVCSVVCQAQSLLAASWGIPHIAWGCGSDVLSKKEVYPTFTRMIGTYIARAAIFDSLADVFGWKRIGIISTQEDPFNSQGKAIMEDMRKHGKEVILQVIETSVRGDQIDADSLATLTKVMENMKKKVHIFIVMTYSDDFKNILITALDLGMMSGEYVFITNEDILSILGSPQSWSQADQLMYNGLIAIGGHEPSGQQYDAFLQNVIDDLQDPQFDHLPHLPADASIDKVNIYAGISNVKYPLKLYTQKTLSIDS